MCHDIPTQVGYPEALTDPSYRGQILVLTFPLVGNYGVPSMDTKDKWDLPLYFESDDVQIAGLVVSNYSADPSHWASQQSLGNWLAKAGVPAIFGADSVYILNLNLPGSRRWRRGDAASR